MDDLEKAWLIGKIKRWGWISNVTTGMALYVVILHLVHLKHITPLALDGIFYAAIALGTHQYTGYLKKKFGETYGNQSPEKNVE